MSELTKFERRIKAAKNNLLPGITVSVKDGMALVKELKSYTASTTNEHELNHRISILEAVLETKNQQIAELSKPINVTFDGDKF